MRRNVLQVPQSHYAYKLDGSTQYRYKITPANMDLNDEERITTQTNRDFETSVGDWTGAGTHSISQSNTDKHAGTYSGKIVATDVGDGTTNYVTLAASRFTDLVIGEKYTFEVWARSETATTTMTVVIGTQIKTSGNISTVAGTFSKVTLNFKAVTGDISQPIIIYFNKAATVYIDDVGLAKGYDFMGILFAKFEQIFTTTSIVLSKGGTVSGIPNIGYELEFLGTASTLTVVLGSSAANTVITNSKSMGDNLYHSIIFTFDRTGNGILYIDGIAGTPVSITGHGKIITTATFYIGSRGTSFKKAGYYGECQLLRFITLPSNIDSIIAQIVASKKSLSAYTGGTIVFWNDPKYGGLDKSGNGNNLMNVGNPQIVKI